MQYSISTNTLNGKVDIDKLTKEIQQSTIVTALDHISTSGDVLSIIFKVTLTDTTVLDGIVAAHDGIPFVPSGLVDPNGRRIVRQAAAAVGFSMYYGGPQFTIAQPNSGIWLRYHNGNKTYTDLGSWVSVKCYDGLGNPTIAEIDVVTTEVDIVMPVDIELAGGSLNVPTSLPTGDWICFVYGAPDIPASSGGNVAFVENIMLNGHYEGKKIDLDGRVAKYMTHIEAIPSTGMWANKLRFVFKHPSGQDPTTNPVKFQITLEAFAKGING